MSDLITPYLRFRQLWLLTGYALLGLVVFLSLVSVPVDMEMNFPYEDKVYHALAYFTLMAWFSQIYHHRTGRIVLALLLVALGVLLEYLQSFDPARFTEFGDMVANTTGVVLGFIVTLKGARNCLVRVESLFG